MNKKIVVTLFTILFSQLALAGTLKTEAELKPFAESVMANIAKGNLPAAFERMKPYVIIPDAEYQAAALNSKAQRDQFGIRYGNSVGYEFISEKKLGESLVRVTYIEKTEKHALPWVFYFYKAPNGWVLNSFMWNDQMPQLFITER